MKRAASSIMSVVIAASSTAALAGGDIGLRVENGVVTTWEAEHSPIQFIKPERVFVGDLHLHGSVVEGDEPGFVIESGSVLGGHRLGFNFRRAARVWDSIGGDFNTISPLAITMERSLIGDVTTPMFDPAAPLPGLSIVVPTGGLDFHYEFILGGNTAGLYLLELEKWSEAPGVGLSQPFWVILNYDMPHIQEQAAVDWVNANLVPTPGSAAVLVLAGLAAARRRRR
jgi:hypothetical protein